MLLCRLVNVTGCMLVMILVTACSPVSKEREYMLNYMDNKYGESFSIVDSYGGQLGNQYSMIQVEGRYAENALVRVAYENGKSIYQDNYMGFIHRLEMQRLLLPIATQAFGSCKLYYRVPNLVFPTDVGAETTAGEILRNPLIMNRVYVYPQDYAGNNFEKMEKLRAGLQKEGYCISGIVSFPANEDWYKQITELNFGAENYLGYEAYEEISFKVDENGEFLHLKWIKSDWNKADE